MTGADCINCLFLDLAFLRKWGKKGGRFLECFYDYLLLNILNESFKIY